MNNNFYNHYTFMNGLIKDSSVTPLHIELQVEKINFFNHGYMPVKKEVDTPGSYLKTCSSLYLHLLENELTYNLHSKNILDVGCGRGGGINTLSHIYKFNDVSACDFNLENITFCKQNYNNISFTQCDALNLQYPSNYFDYVLNVESSHCYSDVNKFFSEVKRVLNLSGTFLYTDAFTTVKDAITVESKLKNNGFNIKSIEDITYNVYLSCEYLCNFFTQLNTNTNNNQNNITMFLENLYRFKAGLYKVRRNVYYVFKASI